MSSISRKIGSNFEKWRVFSANLNALSPDEEYDYGFTDEELVTGAASCNCPVDCDSTIYHTEMSAVPMKDDPLIIERLKKTYEPVVKLYKSLEGFGDKKAINNCTEDMATEENPIPPEGASKEEVKKHRQLTTCQRILKNEADAKKTIEDIKSHASLVHIYFKQLGMVKYVRDELYGIMDVIGNVAERTMTKEPT